MAGYTVGMRSLFLFLLLAPSLSGLALLLQGGGRLREFLRSTPHISSRKDLESFKDLARSQMRGALLQAVLLPIPIIAFTTGVLRRILLPSDFIWILLCSLPLILTALRLRRDEKRVWALPTTDVELEAEKDHVVSSWRFRMLPDF